MKKIEKILVLILSIAFVLSFVPIKNSGIPFSMSCFTLATFYMIATFYPPLLIPKKAMNQIKYPIFIFAFPSLAVGIFSLGYTYLAQYSYPFLIVGGVSSLIVGIILSLQLKKNSNYKFLFNKCAAVFLMTFIFYIIPPHLKLEWKYPNTTDFNKAIEKEMENPANAPYLEELKSMLK